MDKKNAVVELYHAIQRAVGGSDGKAANGLEVSPGLGSMSESNVIQHSKRSRL
jgi:hypothetical protein